MNDKHGFPNTHHSMINRIQEGDEDTRLLALTDFANSYRTPLIDYLIKCLNIDRADAEDLVQQFFLDKIMSGKVLGMANNKGRFRSALRTSLYNFFVDSKRAQKREGIERHFDVDLDEDASEAINPIDLVWATALFRTSLARMKNESQHWELFFDRVLTQPPLPYDQIIEKHGYSDPGKASNLLMTAKRQFNRILNDSVGSQSYLSGVSGETEYQNEINLLTQLLSDSKMIGEIVKTLDDSCLPEPAKESVFQHSILGEHVLFIPESPDKSWDRSDADSMIKHLLSQTVGDFIELELISNEWTLSDLLFDNQDDAEALPAVKALKECFNERGKAKQSSLPERVDVAMTFTMIARYVTLGGEVEDVTSMRRDVLTQRLEQLVEKDWIPSEIRDLIGAAVNRLLS